MWGWRPEHDGRFGVDTGQAGLGWRVDRALRERLEHVVGNSAGEAGAHMPGRAREARTLSVLKQR